MATNDQPVTYVMAARGLKPGDIVIDGTRSRRIIAAPPASTGRPGWVALTFTDGGSIECSYIRPFDVIARPHPQTWPFDRR